MPHKSDTRRSATAGRAFVFAAYGLLADEFLYQRKEFAYARNPISFRRPSTRLVEARTEQQEVGRLSQTVRALRASLTGAFAQVPYAKTIAADLCRKNRPRQRSTVVLVREH